MSNQADLVGRRSVPILGLLLLLLLGVSNPGLAYEQQIAAEAVALAEAAASAEASTLAVVDFTDLQGEVTELGRFLAEELSIALASEENGLRVVDRTHLKAILQENKLSATGLIDPKTARELGRIAGVQGLITGTVTPLGETVRLSIKVLDTETAQIMISTATDIPKTDAITELLRRGISQIGSTMRSSQPRELPADRAESKVEVKEFVFRLQGCELSTKTLRCSLTVTNIAGEDRAVWITPGSRVIDRYGEEHYATRAKLGSAEGSQPKATLIRHVPVAAAVSFTEVPSYVSDLPALEIPFSMGYRGSGKAQFRNVPVKHRQ